MSAEEHRAIVDDFCDFMAGQTDAFVKRIEKEMYAASAELDFERAARLRDDLGALNRALEKQAVVLGDGTDADVVALEDDPLEVAVQIFHVRGGPGPRPARLGRGEDRGRRPRRARRAVPAAAVRRRAGGRACRARSWSRPCPDDAPALETLAQRGCGAAGCSVRVPQRGRQEGAAGDGRPQRQAGAGAAQDAAGPRDLTTRNQALEEIQEALGLPEAPLRIECYDISNLQGTEVVASMVVFEDGLARKSEYRRFVIRRVDGQNDVARDARGDHPAVPPAASTSGWSTPTCGARGEVDRGRAARCWSTPTPAGPRKFAYAPGLVVVDGGPPQVAAAQRALDELGIDDIPVCGLAKRLEEVWLPGQEDPVILPRTSEALFLLQRVRDEAHRFAITHHRSRRSKTMVESLLDDVPGLGEVRRKALLKRFGSLRKMRAAPVEEIAAVPGIGSRTAEAIVAALAEQPGPRQPPVSVNTATGEIEEAELTARRPRDRAHRDPSRQGELIVVTGMTGAGRSTAAKELEDLGYFVVDNLPPTLVQRRRPDGRGDATAPSSRSPSSSTSGRARSSSRLREVLAKGSPVAAPRCSSSRPTTTCSCAGRRPPAGRTRSRPAGGCSTGCCASAR